VIYKPRKAGASSHWQALQVRVKRAQAARQEPGKLEPVARNSRQTDPAAIWSPAAECVTRKAQVILNLGLGPKPGLDQSKERRNIYAPSCWEDAPAPSLSTFLFTVLTEGLTLGNA
jgi:hypothetical protein